MQRIGKARAAEGYSAILILRICHGGCDGGGANARVVSMAALLGIAGRGGDAAPGYARLKVRPLISARARASRLIVRAVLRLITTSYLVTHGAGAAPVGGGPRKPASLEVRRVRDRHLIFLEPKSLLIALIRKPILSLGD